MTSRSKLCLVVILLTVFSVIPVLAQNSNAASIAAVTSAEAEKWRVDLKFMADEMVKRHHNLFHTATREQFESAVKSLNDRIPTLTRSKIIVEFARIVAMVQDGHTNMGDLLFDPKIGFRSYPLTLYFFKDGLFVLAADREHADVVGGRVVKIGNASAESAFESIKGLVFHDQKNEFGLKGVATMYLVSPEVLNAVGVVENMESAAYVIEKDGKQMTIDLKPFVRAAPTMGHSRSYIKPDGWIDAIQLPFSLQSLSAS